VATADGPEVDTSPADSSPPDTPAGGLAPAVTGDTQAPKRNRTLITVLVVVLVVVVGGIAYFAVKRNNNSTTTTTTPAATSPSAAVAAASLAASVNLRLGDLPTGWVRAPATGQIPSPPVAPVPAQAQANQALAGCLGVSYQTVAGLFDNATLPGQTGAARSLTYQSGSNPNVLMYSLATVLGSTAQVQALEVPFTNPNFATCFGQYQSSLAAAAAPGATAQVQAVTLSAPAGVTAYGYLTTLTIPNQGSDVIGEAFLLGGRIETLLAPSTNGPSVPSTDFNPAFDAVAARMAAAVNR
jgi:Kef-type K+ transport system membrane component KefB